MPREVMFIGDIAGEFDALLRLIDRSPVNAKIVCVGDLVDRGPKSRDVIEYLMAHPDIVVLRGNHEDMMIDAWAETEIYQRGVWQRNGGTNTIANYGTIKDIPEAHIRWLVAQPYSYVTYDRRCYATHAPWYGARMVTKRDFERTLLKAPGYDGFGMIWNRQAPVRQPMFGVFGHNSHWGLKYINEPGDAAAHAVCIDTSQSNVLTAFVWPGRQVLQEPFTVARG